MGKKWVILVLIILSQVNVVADTHIIDFKMSRTDLLSYRINAEQRNGDMICEVTDEQAFHSDASLHFKSTLDLSQTGGEGANSVYIDLYYSLPDSANVTFAYYPVTSYTLIRFILNDQTGQRLALDYFRPNPNEWGGDANFPIYNMWSTTLQSNVWNVIHIDLMVAAKIVARSDIPFLKSNYVPTVLQQIELYHDTAPMSAIVDAYFDYFIFDSISSSYTSLTGTSGDTSLTGTSSDTSTVAPPEFDISEVMTLSSPNTIILTILIMPVVKRRKRREE